jgi:hypothetical protein
MKANFARAFGPNDEFRLVDFVTALAAGFMIAGKSHR